MKAGGGEPRGAAEPSRAGRAEAKAADGGYEATWWVGGAGGEGPPEAGMGRVRCSPQRRWKEQVFIGDLKDWEVGGLAFTWVPSSSGALPSTGRG